LQPEFYIFNFAFCISFHGAIFVAGSLQPLWPFEPTAATRNQYFVPLVSPSIAALDLAETVLCCHELFVAFTPISAEIGTISTKITLISPKITPIRFSRGLLSHITPDFTCRPQRTTWKVPAKIDEKQAAGGQVQGLVKCGVRFHHADGCKHLLDS